MPFCLIGALGGISFLTGFGLLLVSSSGAASFFGLPGDFLGAGDASGAASFFGDAFALASFLGVASGGVIC